jgi:hypothetical protein
MQTVSTKWAPALATDHGMAVRVDVMYNGATTAADIQFVDGSVTVDRGSDTRRSLSLTIADPKDFPTTETGTFGVYGQRLWVQAGLVYLDGTVEMVPLGLFVITSVGGNIHTGPLGIQAAGLEILLKRTEAETAKSSGSGVTNANFISGLVTEVAPTAGFVNQSTSGTAVLPTRTWDAGTDYWTIASEVATAIGAELFCNANGTFILADVPDIDSPSISTVWDVTTGDTGVMVSADVDLTSEDVFNRVIASGENTADNAAPVTGTATITSLADPLRYGGPFGKVTKSYSSALITTTAKALAAAAAMLRRYRAPNRTVTLQTIPNPALDVSDRIRVDYGPGIDPELHLVQSFSVPLSVTGGATSIATISGRTDA